MNIAFGTASNHRVLKLHRVTILIVLLDGVHQYRVVTVRMMMQRMVVVMLLMVQRMKMLLMLVLMLVSRWKRTARRWRLLLVLQLMLMHAWVHGHMSVVFCRQRIVTR